MPGKWPIPLSHSLRRKDSPYSGMSFLRTSTSTQRLSAEVRTCCCRHIYMLKKWMILDRFWSCVKRRVELQAEIVTAMQILGTRPETWGWKIILEIDNSYELIPQSPLNHAVNDASFGNVHISQDWRPNPWRTLYFYWAAQPYSGEGVRHESGLVRGSRLVGSGWLQISDGLFGRAFHLHGVQ